MAGSQIHGQGGGHERALLEDRAPYAFLIYRFLFLNEVKRKEKEKMAGENNTLE